MSGLALELLKEQAMKRLGKEGDNRKRNSDDIYYHWVDVAKKNGKVKAKKEPRPLPPGITGKDGDILMRVRKKAYRLDQGFSCCCGFRFGWSAIIGLLPLIGDVLELFMSLSLIRTASRVDGGLPKRLYSMMMFNIVLDFAAGFVPILGDLIDFWYRANTRNAWLLDGYLTVKGEAILAGGIRDPNSNKVIPVPAELKGEEVEQGVEPARMTQVAAAPAVVPPARTPAPKVDMAPPPQTGPPVRNLTSQARPGGRQAQDPRDRPSRKR